jgi:GTP diphosphokinase / guanosine-3',5'-bis(diphosphate) 3'-diphosphatase
MVMLVKLAHAYDFAARAHTNQRRLGVDAKPYINHVVDVAHWVAQAAPHNPDYVVVALLHDVLEDTEISADELTAVFGAQIVAWVSEVTDDMTQSKDWIKAEQLRTAPMLSECASLVRVADKISNLSEMINNPPTNWTVERQHIYYLWCAQVVQACPYVPPLLQQAFANVYDAGRALHNLPDLVF